MTYESTTITTDTDVEDGEKTLQTLEKAAELNAINSGEVPERPDWLPEGFDSVDAFLADYNRLKDGTETPEDEETADPNATQDDDQEDTEDEPKYDAEQVVEDAGLDFQALTSEYMQNGGLSDETYQALEDAGLPRELVDTHIAGLEAQAELTRYRAAEAVGGEENLQALLDWAGKSLSEREIDHINSLVEANDFDGYLITLQGIQSRYEAQYGSIQGNPLAGSTGGAVTDVYQSMEELKTDMRDPRYQRDEAFRAKVEAKLVRSRRSGSI